MSQGAVGSQRTRGFDAEVADDLQVGGDAAVGVEGARGGRAAHGELGDVRRGGVQGAGSSHRDVSVQADASVGEAGQQRAVFLADRYQGVLDLEISRRALQLGRLHEGGGGEAIDRQIGGGGDAAAVLQGGDAAVDKHLWLELVCSCWWGSLLFLRAVRGRALCVDVAHPLRVGQRS